MIATRNHGFLMLGLCALLAGCSEKSDADRPDIFLITIDTLRADRLGCYGYAKDTSPNIDRFAEEALLFEKCFSHAPDTRMSFASILTGFYPYETKISGTMQLPDEVLTLQEILKEEGYQTVAVISNYVLRNEQGFEQGFDVYDDTMKQRELVRRWPERIAEDTTKRAVELIERRREGPLFMWIHYQDPHGPYAPPEEYSGKFFDPDQKAMPLKVNLSRKDPMLGFTGRGGIPSYQYLNVNDYRFYAARYDGEINYCDTEFGKLIASLKQRGRYDASLIIFTSDHGEGLGEHDYYFAHGEYLYNHQLNVPLIIRYGNQLKGRRSDFVQHIDLLPTIRRILDLRSDKRLRGSDLREKGSSGKWILSEMNFPLIRDDVKFSLISDGMKLIYTPMDQQCEFYDIAKDFDETKDLMGDAELGKQAAEGASRLSKMVNEDRLGLSHLKQSQALSEEELENLHGLGYVK